ncbi:hypothetical protein HRG84_05935 [Flavisolibacter sp. BT320]|nr:hypothetical protein [Flavisolibacter longurius]
MNKTTLQFRSLAQLAAFIEHEGLANFELNHNALTICCEMSEETKGKAMADFQASVYKQEVLG